MRLMKGLLTTVVALASLAAAAAQTHESGNRPPTVKLNASANVVTWAVTSEDGKPVPACPASNSRLRLLADASDPDGDRLLYTYLTIGGILSGDGGNTTLDLTGVAPGVYKVTVTVDDSRGGTASDTTSVEVSVCGCGLPAPTAVPCPTVAVSCPSEPVRPGAAGPPISFTARVNGGDPTVKPTFNWAVSAGTIKSGQGTASITVDPTSLPPGSSLTATVDVGGYDRSCNTSASCSTAPWCPVVARKFDEYGVIAVGLEKFLLDNFTVELQNDPTAQGYLICYGGRRSRAGEARRRCERARTYLISTRGIEAPRVVTVDGGLRDALTLELWLMPSGATTPQPTPTHFTGRGRR